MTKPLSKECLYCGTTIFKKKNSSLKSWNERVKFCSRTCIGKYCQNGKATRFKKGHILFSNGDYRRKYTGSENHKWKGGVTPIYEKIRKSPQYKQWRELIFERNDYTCQLCGKRGGDLHADHIMPFAYYPKLRFDLDNGRTLCVECHKKTPTYAYKAGMKIIVNSKLL